MRRPFRSLGLYTLIPTLLLATWLFACRSSNAGPPSTPQPQPQSSALPTDVRLLKVSVLDVGQGDGILIQAPNGKNVLIDAGPGARQALVINQLDRLGVKQIDLAVETHPHEDHIGNFDAVLDRYKVRFFMDPGTTHTTATYQKMLLKLKEKNVQTMVARAGMKPFKIDEGVYLDVLGPREPLLKGTESDLNNNSTITRLRFGNFSMLFTGDAEEEGEKRLLESGVPKTSVLKLGHHGSKSSSSHEFVEAVDPQLGVFSCEVGNDYGHPHEKTLTTFGRRNIPLYRTDQEGQVRLLTDGRRLWVQTFSRSSISTPGSVMPEPTRTVGPITLRAAEGGSKQLVAESDPAPAPAPAVPATNTTRSAAPAPAASGATSGEFIASQKSNKFHKASCGNAKRITEANRVYYATRQEAVAAGKEPAQDCKP